MAVDLGTELQRLTRRMQPRRAGVQYRPAVAKARHTVAIEQMRVDARNLRRGVGPNAEGSPTELIDELEGLQPQLVAGSRQKRFQVFQQRRHHQLAAIATRHVEEAPSKLFDVPRLSGQDVGDVLWQQPSRQHVKRPGR